MESVDIPPTSLAFPAAGAKAPVLFSCQVDHVSPLASTDRAMAASTYMHRDSAVLAVRECECAKARARPYDDLNDQSLDAEVVANLV